MDFMNRGFKNPNTQNVEAAPASQGHASAATLGGKPTSNGKGSGKKMSIGGVSQVGKLAFFLLIVSLISLVFAALILFNGKSSESTLVAEDKYQAVFLNGGQVYFGKVTDLNSRYMAVGDIYYLRVNQQVQPDSNAAQNAQNDISLVKLGCELHGPEDRMVINREQVIFWENLKSDGQVAKAIEEYKKQFPEGQKCDEQQQTNSATPSTATEETQTETTPTTTPTTTTPPTNTTPATTNTNNRQ